MDEAFHLYVARSYTQEFAVKWNFLLLRPSIHYLAFFTVLLDYQLSKHVLLTHVIFLDFCLFIFMPCNEKHNFDDDYNANKKFKYS